MCNKIKILIWGCKERGKFTCEKLIEFDADFTIVGFGDNDDKIWGSFCCGKEIFGIEQIKEMPNLDGIVIASQYIDEIYKQLVEKFDIPIYRDVWEFLGVRSSIDITGFCNAKCKWCATGNKNRNREIVQGNEYMNFEQFQKIYEHMTNNKLINRFHEIMLYSWGEPLLNLDYLKIVEYLDAKSQVFSISTNASHLVFADKKIYRHCKIFTFSLSGFTEESYKKIHGFRLDIILDNIKLLLNNIRNSGFCGEAVLSFHVYKFNENEVLQAKNFADEVGLKFVPVKAYLASYSMTRDCLKKTMSEAQALEVNEELLLSHVPALIDERPQGYSCLVENVISINTKGQIELCCCTDDNSPQHIWCNIFEIDNYNHWRKYREEMLSCSTCLECRELGIDYWFFNNSEYVV